MDSPLWITEISLNDATARDARVQRVAICLHGERRQRAGVTATDENPWLMWCVDPLEAWNLCFQGKRLDIGQDLFRSQVGQLVGGRGVIRVAAAIVAGFQNNSEAIELLDQDLNNALLENDVPVCNRHFAA